MRPRISWVIVGAVAVIGLFAGLDAFRSSGDEPPPTGAGVTGALTTTQRERAAELPSSAELLTGRVGRLIPGRVTTNERFPLAVRFTVPAGWYGYQRRSGFVIAESPSGTRLLAASRNVAFGGITVDILDRPLPFVFKDIEAIPHIRVRDVTLVRIGGDPSRRLRADQRGRGPLRELLGLPGVFFLEEEQFMLLGVGRNTLLIRWV
jgi:hypothetical protein